MNSSETLPQILLEQSEKYGDKKVIMREKELGIWQEYTWRDYLKHVKYFSLGLLELGFQAQDKIAILSDNRPQVYWTMLAAQALRGVPVPLYQDSIVKEAQYIIDHSDSKFIMAEDQEQVDKILEIKEGLSKLQKIIYDDSRGMKHYKDPSLVSFAEVEKLGENLAQRKPGLFEDLVKQGKKDDLSLICYTSGTTGNPKGAMLSHNNLISAVRNIKSLEDFQEDDEILAYLPPAWIGDSFFSLSMVLILGMVVNCPEKPETVMENMREIGPTLLVAPPRIWENIVSTIQVKIQDADLLKRNIYQWFIKIGQEFALKASSKQPLGLWKRLLHFFGEFFVFGPLRDHIGLRKIRYAYTGGAALGPEVFMFFRSIGVNLKQVYGQTEITGISCVHPNGKVKPETVGVPIGNTEVKLTDSGEIITKSPGVFIGYYKNPEATAETLKEGWLYSGDAGLFDEDGQLICIDRAKDVTSLAGGAKFAPQFIENKLKYSPYIKEAVVIGQNRAYVAAMINIDMENVGKWSERNQIAYTTYNDLSQKPEVYDLVFREVQRVNKDLPKATQINKYLLLHKELDADDEEITRTRKLRRRVIFQKYGTIIEALYSGEHIVPVIAEVTYQDGRKSSIETKIQIKSMDDR